MRLRRPRSADEPDRRRWQGDRYRVRPRRPHDPVSDSDGNTTAFGYDDLDHETSRQTNSQPALTWHYDTHGNVTSEEDRDLRVTAFTYDELDRQLTEKWYRQPRTTRATVRPTILHYELRRPQPHGLAGYNYLRWHGYDNLDRPTTEAIDDTKVGGPVVTLTHGYAATALSPARDDGLETSLTAAIGPSGSQAADFQNLYHDDSNNRLDQVQQGGQRAATAWPASSSRFTTMTPADCRP